MNSLKVSITEVNFDKAIKMVLMVRNSRRSWVRPKKKSSTTKVRKPKAPPDPMMAKFKAATKGMSKQQILALMQKHQEGGKSD